MKKKEHSNKRHIFLNTFYISLGSIVEKFFLFLITVLIVRYLSVKEYGYFATALGLATFFSLFANLDMNTAIIRAINKNKGYKDEIFTGSLLIKLILTILVYVSLIIALFFTGYNRNVVVLTLILGLVRVAGEFIYTLHAFYEAQEKFNITSLLLITFSSLFLTGTIIVILAKGDYFDLAWVRLFVTLFFLVLIFSLLKKSHKLKYNFKIIKEFILGFIPFCGSFAAKNISAYSGIVLLPLLHGTIYAGIYQNAYLMLTTITFLHSILLRVLIPFLYKFPLKENKDKFQFSYDIYSKIFGTLSFYLCIIIFLFSSDILLLLFGDKYLSSVPVLKIFSFVFPFISVAPIIITTIDKQKINTMIDSIVTFSNIILSYILIYFYKLEGAAVAVLASFIIGYGLYNYYLIFIKKFKYRETFLLNLKLVLLIIAVYFIHIKFTSNFYFIISMSIDSLIYFILLAIFIVRKDDLRIIKEIISGPK